MTLIPQPYPLWLAQVVDEEIQAGRVLAWVVSEEGAASPDPAALAQPVVLFGDDDGYVWATMEASRTAPRFICESRGAALDAAEKWVYGKRKRQAAA